MFNTGAHIRRFLAGLALAAALAAQSSAPALNTVALEAYVRHLLMWPAGVEVTIGAPKPSPLPGFYRVNVQGSLGGRSKVQTFYVSADSQTVIRGDVFDVKKNPFQDQIDLMKTDDRPFLGTPGAPVTVVEFGDFQCPYCKQESGVIRTELLQAFPQDVQLYFMDYPIDGIHPFARGAAILGRCIYTQNNASFWAYHDWIFEHQAEITPENLREKVLAYAAGDKNLNGEKLAACAVSPEPRADVDRSVAMGDALNIDATPTLFINGRRMVGTVPLEDLKLVVGAEIAYAKTLKKDADCCSVQLSLPGMGKAAQ